MSIVCKFLEVDKNSCNIKVDDCKLVIAKSSPLLSQSSVETILNYYYFLNKKNIIIYIYFNFQNKLINIKFVINNSVFIINAY